MVRQIYETRNLCGWDETTTTVVLELITNTEYLPTIRMAQALDQKINLILCLEYLVSQEFTYTEALSNIRKNDFYNRQLYQKDWIPGQKFGNSRRSKRNSSSRHNKRDILQWFAKKTKLKMTRLSVHTFSHMYRILNETENLAIQRNGAVKTQRPYLWRKILQVEILQNQEKNSTQYWRM